MQQILDSVLIIANVNSAQVTGRVQWSKHRQSHCTARCLGADPISAVGLPNYKCKFDIEVETITIVLPSGKPASVVGGPLNAAMTYETRH